MAVGRYDKDNNFVFKHSIYKPMLVTYMPTPSTFRLSLQRFGMSCALKGMLIELCYQL